jgi:hypothetical protein
MSSFVFSLHRLVQLVRKASRGHRNVGKNIGLLDGNFVVGFMRYRSIDVWQYRWRGKRSR